MRIAFYTSLIGMALLFVTLYRFEMTSKHVRAQLKAVRRKLSISAHEAHEMQIAHGTTREPPELKVHDFVNNTSPEAMDTGTRLLDSLQAAMPRRLGFDRIFMVTMAVLHLCADRSRIEDSIAPVRRQMTSHEFTENVVDMAHGALFAPVRETAT